ncbi:hypothetical protein JCGZ_04833 [Jatropha curcas]|uniref:Brf1 TBP-binding domain-containing protein n=1 Tax=Jatropha curcas TaxID=180498 RepID=A0A067L134_JATCU|nr:uncharacterized protein LOC105634186 [Jatropha curcas]KDP38190.1 hypothetical protein JCGZ_04833 [Jatropha curcas]
MEKQVRYGELDLTGINDAEIAGYLNGKKEIQFRKLMWELLNRDRSRKGKRPQKALKSKKKEGLANKAVKIDGDLSENMKRTRVSCKINYDALKKLMEEETKEKSTSPEMREEGEYAAGDDYKDMYNDENCEEDDFDYESYKY